MTFAKPPHDYFLHLCASSATNQTSPEEDQRLAEHLQFCLVCKQACDDFNQIAVQLYGEARAAETVTATFRVADEAPPERLKARELLLSKVRRTIDLPLTEDQPTAIAGKKKMSWVPSLERVPLGVAWRLAAALLLVVGLVLTQSSLSRRHSRDEEATSTRLKREVQELRGELTRLQMIPGKPALEAPPKTRDDGARNLQANNEAIHQTLLNLEAARQREAGENAELQTRIRLLQSSLEVLQALNTNLEADKSGLAERVSSTTEDLRKSQEEMGKLAARNEELSQDSLAHVKSAERQQKLLATDHDITEILGARSLHIINVFDVSSQGEFERPFGRIFYTEGKSLIFYAFDLDQQKGLKRGVVFQAWGQKGEGKQDPRSLGAFYMDDPSQNRWVLKVDDSKALSHIDYIFVSDSTRREGVRPKGRPLLSAFLTTTANHP